MEFSDKKVLLILPLIKIIFYNKTIMILLITKYNLSPKWTQMLIYLAFYFIFLNLYTFVTIDTNIIECMQEHPLYKQKTASINEFAPPKKLDGGPILNSVVDINSLITLGKFEKALTIKHAWLNMHSNEALSNWLKFLNKNVYIGKLTDAPLHIQQKYQPEKIEVVSTLGIGIVDVKNRMLHAGDFVEILPTRSLFFDAKNQIQEILSDRREDV